MAPRNLWLQLRRFRRRLWPAERGTFRREGLETIVGLIFLVAANRWLQCDYSYLLETAENPRLAAAILNWTTLGISALATSFLVGCFISRMLAYMYSFLPRSWRSSKYRSLKS